ncbi:unannotated protein [freshwater metagenome]|uniref:Unannotated protein n=1 Tax=freshwater metagenome TaxID=449393 RepID=A0A6J7NL86_9ZZZZ
MAMQGGQDGEALLELGISLHPEHDLARHRLMTVLASRLGYASVVVPRECANADELAVDLRSVAAGTVVEVDDPTDVHVVRAAHLDAIRVARATLDAAGDTRRVVVAVPVAIGRTTNEAAARASRDSRFVGDQHPELSGIFGTFEQAQRQVIEIAGAGGGALRVTLADDPDIADLMAQVRALVVGPTVVLHRQGP